MSILRNTLGGMQLAVVLLMALHSCQQAAGLGRGLTQASWKTVDFSLVITLSGNCSRQRQLPNDFNQTFAEAARRDAERLPNVVLAVVTGRKGCLNVQARNRAWYSVFTAGVQMRGPSVSTAEADRMVQAGVRNWQIGGMDCAVFRTTCQLLNETKTTIRANNASYAPNGDVDPAFPARLPSPSPRPPNQRTLLKISDFTYKGAFALPYDVCGGQRTSWSSGGIAIRRVNGELRFFAVARGSEGAIIYEAGDPSTPPWGNYTTCTGYWRVARVDGDKWCGDAYQGRRTLTPGAKDDGTGLLTHGLNYNAQRDRLYWTFGQNTKPNNTNDFFLGYTKLGNGTGSSSAKGPWKIEPTVSVRGARLNSQKVRGGALDIPEWFADLYLGGRSLGLGFGGFYYNMTKGASMGPALVAVRHPTDSEETGTLRDPIELLGYGWGTNLADFDTYANRNVNVTIDRDLLPWGYNQNRGWNKRTRGYWAPGDSIEGGAAWVDNGTHHGLIYFADLSMNELSTEEDLVTLKQTHRQSYWFVYDPMDLVAVAEGQRQPWQVNWTDSQFFRYPATTGIPGQGSETGQKSRITGAAWDSQSQTLFIVNLHSGNEPREITSPYHVVHAYSLDNTATTSCV